MSDSYTSAVSSVTVPADDQQYVTASAEYYMNSKNQLDSTISSNLQANEIDDASSQTQTTQQTSPTTPTMPSSSDPTTTSSSPYDSSSNFYSS